MKKIFYLLALTLVSGCQTYQFSSDPFIVGMRWFDRGNLKLARNYWEPLAQKNDCDGQNGMALILYHEILKTPDKLKIKESLAYFEKSAAQGHFKSLSALGDLNYCSNETKKMCDVYGFKQNQAEAFKYYALAEKFSISDHDKIYNQTMKKQLETIFPSEQRKSAENKVAQWKPTPELCTPRKVN